MRDAEMNHWESHYPEADPSQLDPEMVLVLKYLHNELSPEDWDRVDERLAEDEDYHERASRAPSLGGVVVH